MRIGKSFSGRPVQAPKNYRRGFGDLPVAQDAVDAAVNRANRQLIEAINVDGVRYLHWSKAMEGFACTCKGVKPEQTDGGGLTNVDTTLHQPSISWSLTDSDSFEVRGIGDKRQSRDDGYHEIGTEKFGLVDDAEVDKRTIRVDFNEDDLETDSDDDSNYVANILDNLSLNTGNAQCGICLDTGLVNGYKLVGGDRIIFDASGQMPVISSPGFTVNKEATPYRFTFLGADSGYVLWKWKVPAYFTRALSVVVRNNTNAAHGFRVEYKLSVETQDIWKELTAEAINSFKGLSVEIFIRVVCIANDAINKEFSHVEISLQYTDFKKLQMPPLTDNSNLAVYESPISVAVIVPPSEQKVQPLDIFYEGKYDRMWKVIDVTDAMTSKFQVFGWQVTLRLLMNSETAQVLRVFRDPELNVAFSAMHEYRVPSYSNEDTLNYTSTAKSVQERAKLKVRSIVLEPFDGEFTLGTTPELRNGDYDNCSDSGYAYLRSAVDYFKENYPNLSLIWLTPTWYGTDLRAGSCVIEPRVFDNNDNCAPLNWVVSGKQRNTATLNSQFASKPAFYGTINDVSLIEAILFLKSNGYKVGLKPTLKMDITDAQNLPAPGGVGVQPRYPFSSDITFDNIANAVAETANFFGTHVFSDFVTNPSALTITTTSTQWNYTRFIMHYANLAELAGGVYSFCIGSDLRGLTLKSSNVIDALKTIADDLATNMTSKITYEASCYEYGAQINGNAIEWPLDALWASDSISYVSIKFDVDWTDWNASPTAIDNSRYVNIYNSQYLRDTLQGGIEYNFYYQSPSDRTSQVRTPITDYRLRRKAFSNWVRTAHVVRNSSGVDLYPTAWEPLSKPIAFTDFVIPSIDRGTNGNYRVSLLQADPQHPYMTSNAVDVQIAQAAIDVFQSYWGEPSVASYNNHVLFQYQINCSGHFNITKMDKEKMIWNLENRQLLNWAL